MDSYEKLEEELKEVKAYSKRVIDLYCDAKKWKMLAKMSDTDEKHDKYMEISNTLMDMFMKEVQSMKL